MDKVPVIEDEAFTAYLEEYSNLLFVHCDVYKWNKTTNKKMKAGLDFLVRKYNQPIFAAQIDNDNKHRKFLDMYGFKYIGVIKDFEGDNRTIFVKGVNNNG
jgi:hypothetical protein